MLPQFLRYVLVNNSGQTLTYNSNGRVNVKVTAWIISPSTGKIAYTQLDDDDLGFVAASALANGAEIIGDIEIDNTSNLYLGLQVQLEITHDLGGAAEGTFDLYISVGDATGELQTDASGYGDAEAAKLDSVGMLTWEPNGQDDEVMLSNIREI